MLPFKSYVLSYVITGKLIYRELNDIFSNRKYQVCGFSYFFKKEIENKKK